jgi:hypothetical protein
MTSSTSLETLDQSRTTQIQGEMDLAIASLLQSFPPPARLTGSERRGIIARYTAVLEGNFIYWMTGALLSLRSEQARAIVLENLQEEVRDCHPGMMRRFAIGAHAIPTDTDAVAVYRNLAGVRLFVGRLSGAPMLVMMAFFEGFLQQFMPYLAELAALQGSTEMEYTDVHGVCDVAHTQGLFRALDAEMALTSDTRSSVDLLEGVELLRALITTIIHPE